jgi:hypothetical protein
MFSRPLTALWRKGLAVNRSWRTCRSGGKTTARQLLNSTRNGFNSQVYGGGLWINKYLIYKYLRGGKRSPLRRSWIRRRVKPDRSFRQDGGLPHLLDGCKNSLESGVVFAFHLLCFPAQFFVGGQHSSELHKGPHDRDVDVHGARTAQNAGEHGHTPLSKGELWPFNNLRRVAEEDGVRCAWA